MFPNALGGMWQHPAQTEAQKDRLVDEFFALRQCCCSPPLCEKVFSAFGGDPERLRRCPHYKKAIKAWSNGYSSLG